MDFYKNQLLVVKIHREVMNGGLEFVVPFGKSGNRWEARGTDGWLSGVEATQKKIDTTLKPFICS